MKKLIILLTFFSVLTISALGFGKNKVRYDNFKWKVKETKHFDIYYYPEFEHRIKWIANTFESSYDYLSKRYDFKLSFRPPIILYKNHRHFEQTNIMPGFIPGNVGGFAEIIKKRLVIPINGSRYNLETLIVHELNHLFQFDYFYQNKIQLIGAVPMYIMEGFSLSYSYDWDMEGRMVLRDAFLNNNFYDLQRMRNFYVNPNVYLCYKESQAFVDFLIENFGDEKVKLFLRNIRRNPKINFDKTLKDSFGYKEKELSDLWINKMKKKFWPMIKEKEVPEIAYGRPIGFTSEYYVSFKPVYFPSGDFFAFMTSKNQQLDIYIQGADNKETIKRLTEQDTLLYEYIITDGNAISISPDGDLIALFVRDDEADKLLLINIVTGEKRKIKFPGYEALSSPSWGADSKTIAFAADKFGQADIWTYNIETEKFEQWTKDTPQDYTPQFTKDMKQIYFVSEIMGIRKIFLVEKGNANSKKQVTFGAWDDIQPSLSLDQKKLLYISGKVDEIPNIFELDIETNEVVQLTNTLGGIFDVSISPDNKQVIFSCYYNARFNIYQVEREKLPELSKFKNDSNTKIKDFKYLTKKHAKLSKPKKVKFRLEPSYVSSNLAFSTTGELKNYTEIGLSDIMEDHMFILSVNSIHQFSDSYLVYIFKKYRTTFGASVFNYGNYYFFPTLNEVGAHRNYGLSIFMSYPLNKYNRVELTSTYSQLYWDDIFRTYFRLPKFEHELSLTLKFIRDSARWAQFEPISGSRYMLGVKQYLTPKESFKTLTEYHVDFRKYFRLSRRSSYAFRVYGSWSTGPEKFLYFFGGGNYLRGFRYNEFYGTRMFVLNNEFRIPFIDIMRIFGFLDLYYIRGVLYWDIASAWSDDTNWQPMKKDEHGDWRFEDVHSSVGFGLRLRGGYFDLNFYFSKKMDFYTIYPNTIYQFYIGSNF